MTLAITYSRASIGIHAPTVTVETHISNGLPTLSIVGLPETVVKESKDRVRSAIITSHFEFPSRRITVNLAPADLPKGGGRYDLAIALGILAASKQIPNDKLDLYEFAGELALSGELRPISEILSFALATRNTDKHLIIPHQNVEEAALISNLEIYPANHLLEVCAHFLNKKPLSKYVSQASTPGNIIYENLKEVRGQHHAKRALEIAAAGQHSLLLIGPPGVGKTLLSRCLSGLLPPLTEDEAIELATIQSISGYSLSAKEWRRRPFRTPHHSASSFALIGGGNPPRPGEISLAHHGVLFLDELPEYKRQALEALREPLESGSIALSRAKAQVEYPAKFQLITAMNPCPCGQYNNQQGECRCLPDQIKRYQSRISGPLLDRIDLQVELYALPLQLLMEAGTPEECSEVVAKRVCFAREIQWDRAKKFNALLNNQEIEAYCSLTGEDQIALHKLIQRHHLSARSYHKILKVARTIADLEESTVIRLPHLTEAMSYRALEKFKRL